MKKQTKVIVGIVLSLVLVVGIGYTLFSPSQNFKGSLGGSSYRAGTELPQLQATAASKLIILPIAPSNLTVSNIKSSSVLLRWQDNSNYEDYFTIRTSANTIVVNTGRASANQTGYIVTGLTPDTSYSFTVSAVNGNGSAAGTAVSARTLALATPAAPTNLRVTGATSTSVSLAWDDNSSNESYFMLLTEGVDTSAYLGAIVIHLPANLTTVTLTQANFNRRRTIQPGSSYHFSIAALGAAPGVDDDGVNLSAFSNTVEAETLP